jgi:serine/threonine-protein kinase ULK4
MNNFHIYEEVGKGKFSVVYKGRKKKTIDYVAVKSVEKNRRKKVLNEVSEFRLANVLNFVQVRIFHNLKNRHILKFYNWYETRNHLWIIFEYCAGGDLLQLIEQDKILPESTIQKFGRDLAQGLYYLHANGVLYCDLKPSNVLINEYSTLKLCDFGLSRKLQDLQNANHINATEEENKAAGGK